MKVKVIDIVREGMLLPPKPGVCQECAVDHQPELPHNRDSLFYQYKFYQQHGRWPTWANAMEHCTPAMRAQWTTLLGERGVAIDQLPAKKRTKKK